MTGEIVENCKHCKELSQSLLANSPKKLTALLKKVQCFLEKGVIKELEMSNPYSTSFDDILCNGWSDIIYCEFECAYCRKVFKLFADTYHGSSKNGWHIKSESER